VQSLEAILVTPPPQDPLQVSAGELVANTQSAPKLAADAAAGGLLIDGGAPVQSTPTRKKEAEDCGSSAGNRLRPMGANDVRAQSVRSGC